MFIENFCRFYPLGVQFSSRTMNEQQIDRRRRAMSPSALGKRPRRVCKLSSKSPKKSALKRTNKAKTKKTAPKKQKKLAKMITTAPSRGRKKLSITQRRQSPIDIKSDAICHDPEHCKPDSLNIKYTPGDCHDVVCSKTGFKVNVGGHCSTTLSASHLPGTFKLAQFHAHWSKDGTCGSEHLLNGKAMSGEVNNSEFSMQIRFELL
ncbi:hypothetical protein OESDEN_02213 [Oesophagostomum dentatum]|uniref:Alpha-carbonic anhydrase domain-containing protein n=1 Tax=Oesophagostomum dentatum TaxID=61180 RepID=A0A0B1TNX4_OESDE|nr:hypothetical protein OESDEN_02213 [Oesophagostomum dentatum]